MRLPAALLDVLPSNLNEIPTNRGPCGIERDATFGRQLCRWQGARFDPFDYQREIIDGLFEKLGQAPVTGMLVLPTGAGKTSVAIAVALRDLSRLEKGMVLWIAPQRELLQQAIACCERVWWSGEGPHSLDLRVLRGSAESVQVGRHSIVFGTPLTIDRWIERATGVPTFTHVIFDEAHHLGAEVYSEIWERTRSRVKNLRLALGLSATPMRSDTASLETMKRSLDGRLYYPRSLLPEPMAGLRARGVLATLTVRQIDAIPSYARGGSPLTGGTGMLGADSDYWMACINAVRAAPGRLIVYCPTRPLGELFARHLSAVGDLAEFVDGEDTLDTRIAVFERFRDGGTRVIVNVGLLLEGVDCPSADAAFVLYPVQSPTRLIQIAGRVLRGPAVGGAASASIYCANLSVGRFFREVSSDPDYAGLWETGVALGSI